METWVGGARSQLSALVGAVAAAAVVEVVRLAEDERGQVANAVVAG